MGELPLEQDETASYVDRACELEAQAQVEAASSLRVALWVEAAHIWSVSVGDHDAAAKAYEAALALDAGDAALLNALESYLVRAQIEGAAFNRLITPILRLAEARPPQARAALLGSLARIYESVGDDRRAKIVARSALDADPDDRVAQSLLERLDDTTVSVVEPELSISDLVSDDLERNLRTASSGAERAAIYEAMAFRSNDAADGSQEAIRCLERALEIEPLHVGRYDQLEYLYRKIGDYSELAGLLERRIAQVSDDETSTEASLGVWQRLAEVYERDLADRPMALRVYERARLKYPQALALLQPLSRLACELEEWKIAHAAYEEMANHCDESEEKAELFYKVAHLCDIYLSDREQAEAMYERVVQLAPAHPGAAPRLIEWAREAKRWRRCVDLLQKASVAAVSSRDRSHYLFEAATITRNEIRQPREARALFEAVLRADPDHSEAARHLAQLAGQAGDKNRQSQVLEVSLAQARINNDNIAVAEICVQIAENALVGGHKTRAERFAEDAYRENPQDWALLARLADVFAQVSSKALAQTLYMKMGTTPATVTGFSASEQLGFLARARDAACPQRNDDVLRRIALASLRLSPKDRESLSLLNRLGAPDDCWEEVAQGLAKTAAESADTHKAALYSDLGDIYRNALDRSDLAFEAYLEGLRYDPQNRTLLHAKLETASQTRQWQVALETCTDLAKLESDEKVKGKYLYAAAVIARDSLKQPELALGLFEQSLDAYPRRLKAFREIDRYLSAIGDSARLEQSYLRMIARSDEAEPDLKARLWGNIAEIRRERRADTADILDALDEAHKACPRDLIWLEKVAELASRAGPDYRVRLRDTLHQILQISPGRSDIQRRLRDYYMEEGDTDAAWCVTSTLRVLKRAGGADIRYHEQYTSKRLRRANGRLTDASWDRYLHHSDLAPALVSLLRFIGPILSMLSARPLADYGLKKRDLVGGRRDDQSAASSRRIVEVVRYASALLHVPEPALYLGAADRGVSLAHTKSGPVLVVSRDFSQLDDLKECAFAVGQRLAFLRPEFFPRYTLADAEALSSAVSAAIQVVRQGRPLESPTDRQSVERFADHLARHVSRHDVEHLTPIAARVAELDPDPVRWWRALTFGADRAGLLLATDINVATRVVSKSPPSPTSVNPTDRIKELARFCLSQPYFHLRTSLGLRIKDSLREEKKRK